MPFRVTSSTSQKKPKAKFVCTLFVTRFFRQLETSPRPIRQGLSPTPPSHIPTQNLGRGDISEVACAQTPHPNPRARLRPLTPSSLNPLVFLSVLGDLCVSNPLPKKRKGPETFASRPFSNFSLKQLLLDRFRSQELPISAHWNFGLTHLNGHSVAPDRR